MLVLPIKKKWFDMILSGEKKEEYRELTWYWRVRFANAGLLDRYGFGWLPQRVMFRNGYSKTSPSFVALVSADAKEGRSEWGAEPGKIYFVLNILDIENGGQLPARLTPLAFEAVAYGEVCKPR